MERAGRRGRHRGRLGVPLAGGPTPVGVAKYASIQTRELGAAPKTSDGIDVSRERVFDQADLDALVRLPRIGRTLAMVERFAEAKLKPSPTKERLIAG